MRVRAIGVAGVTYGWNGVEGYLPNRLKCTKKLQGGSDIMRNQFYWDARDVSKWSVIVQLAREYQAKVILQVAMLRPDKMDTQGSTRHDPLLCDDAVKRFFDDERRIGIRDFRRVTCLPDHCGFDFEVKVIDTGFWGQGFGSYRAEYFLSVIKSFPDLPSPKIVFLDPDTGMTAADHPSPRHVGCKELQRLFGQMSVGDILLVYQHKPMYARSGSEWWVKAEQLAKDAVGTDVPIKSYVDDDVAFIALHRAR